MSEIKKRCMLQIAPCEPVLIQLIALFLLTFMTCGVESVFWRLELVKLSCALTDMGVFYSH